MISLHEHQLVLDHAIPTYAWHYKCAVEGCNYETYALGIPAQSKVPSVGMISHEAVGRCIVHRCDTAPCDCGLVALQKNLERGYNETPKEIERLRQTLQIGGEGNDMLEGLIIFALIAVLLAACIYATL